MFKSPLTCSAREINIIRKKIRYTKIWREKINLVKQNLELLTEMKINYGHHIL